MTISKSAFARMLFETDIVKVIEWLMGEHSIKQRINNQYEFVGLCPFHSEKTPSFTITRKKQFYHCFGCGAHGNAVKFVEEYEGLDSAQAVLRVAEISGVPIPLGNTNSKRARRRSRKYSKNHKKYVVKKQALRGKGISLSKTGADMIHNDVKQPLSLTDEDNIPF